MLVLLSALAGVVLLFLYVYLRRDRLKSYEKILGLKKANLEYSDNYQKVREIILPARDSVFSKSEPVIWIYNEDVRELFLGSNSSGDVRIWLNLETKLDGVHIVLDSGQNNSLRSNLRIDKLPKQKINLEGDFNKRFRLYCKEDQQIIALQIIAPDVMVFVLDNLLTIDLEIINSQLAIISKGGAKSLDKLKSSLELAMQIDKLSRTVKKVTKI